MEEGGPRTYSDTNLTTEPMWFVSSALRLLLVISVRDMSSTAFTGGPYSLKQKNVRNQLQTLGSSKSESEHTTAHNQCGEENNRYHSTTQSHNMGASIGAENVGNMLFNEDVLKGGRGDIRVGSTGRWKDFKGNEIVRDAMKPPVN